MSYLYVQLYIYTYKSMNDGEPLVLLVIASHEVLCWMLLMLMSGMATELIE